VEIVARWAQEEVAPKVTEMVMTSQCKGGNIDIQDEAEKIEPEIIKGLFDHGV
jgi:hypothetical protein